VDLITQTFTAENVFYNSKNEGNITHSSEVNIPLNMLFAILSSSVTLTRINFVHIINYFSCFIKQ